MTIVIPTLVETSFPLSIVLATNRVCGSTCGRGGTGIKRKGGQKLRKTLVKPFAKCIKCFITIRLGLINAEIT